MSMLEVTARCPNCGWEGAFMATEGQFLHKDWLDKCGKCETDLYQSSWISIDVRSLEKKLNAERATNKELEATCLQLRNEVLHLQGEAKRAYTRGGKETESQIVRWLKGVEQKLTGYINQSTPNSPPWESYRVAAMRAQEFYSGIERGEHMDGEQQPTRCDFRGCTNATPMEEKEACENGWVILGDLMLCPLCRKAVDADLARMEGREDERGDVADWIHKITPKTNMQDEMGLYSDTLFTISSKIRAGAHLHQGEANGEKGKE